MLPSKSVEMPDNIRTRMQGIGRTEDVRFSPNNQILAIADFANHAVFLFHIQFYLGCDSPFRILDSLQLQSSGISNVHGLDFIDDQHLVIANRDADVAILAIPSRPWFGAAEWVEPKLRIPGDTPFEMLSPGSVCVETYTNHLLSLLVCHNFTNRVTRHRIDTTHWQIVEQSIVLESGLALPDGITVSPCKQWIAVSSHESQRVQLYRRDKELNPSTKPLGSLLEIEYPHGLRFTADSQNLIVANAGFPFVHVYSQGDSWTGEKLPQKRICTLDYLTFQKG